MWYKDKPKKPQQKQTSQEKAFALFVQWAIVNNRNYDSDMVKGNLNNSIAAGRSPQQALEDLIKRIP